jgi:hypothetical protein
MGIFLKRDFNFIGKFFLHPLYIGHTMNLGEKNTPNYRDKFGVGATYTPKVI